VAAFEDDHVATFEDGQHGATHMPSKSPPQRRLMRAAASDPGFAKKVGVPQKVAKEFFRADQAKARRSSKGKGKR